MTSEQKKKAGDVRKTGVKVGASKTVRGAQNESNLASKMCVTEGDWKGEGNVCVREPVNYMHDSSSSLTDRISFFFSLGLFPHY
jgi:hypothetical protein